MKRFSFIIAWTCWLFVSVSIIRLLIHLFQQAENYTSVLALIPFVLLVGVLIYVSAGLLWAEHKKSIERL